MQAILTKYHGPTNFRGSRITARSASGLSVSVPYQDELDTEAAHRVAAVALCAKLGWPTDNLVAGGLANGYAFVPSPSLHALLGWATSGARYDVRNPYTIWEIQDAHRAFGMDHIGQQVAR